jgi:hypothetical protein
MFSAKLERWLECGLDDMVRFGCGDRGPELATGWRVGSVLSLFFVGVPSTMGLSAIARKEAGCVN